MEHYGEFVGNGAKHIDPSMWSDLHELLVEAWTDLEWPGEKTLLSPGMSKDSAEGVYLLRNYSGPVAGMGEARFNHDDLIGLSNDAVFYFFPYIARMLWDAEEYPFYLMPEVRMGVPVFADERTQGVHRWRFLLLACVIRIAIRRFLLHGQPDVAIRWEEFLDRVVGVYEPDCEIRTASVTFEANPAGDRAILLWNTLYRNQGFTYCYLLSSTDGAETRDNDAWVPLPLEAVCKGWGRLRLVYALNGSDDYGVSWVGDREVALVAPPSKPVTKAVYRSVFGVKVFFGNPTG
ncbi:MAG: hypothetical protein K8H99_11875 [Nitrospirae bacterium]|nr:hypothetical protein [Fimbriimonadaceae bacterium]